VRVEPFYAFSLQSTKTKKSVGLAAMRKASLITAAFLWGLTCAVILGGRQRPEADLLDPAGTPEVFLEPEAVWEREKEEAEGADGTGTVGRRGTHWDGSPDLGDKYDHLGADSRTVLRLVRGTSLRAADYDHDPHAIDLDVGDSAFWGKRGGGSVLHPATWHHTVPLSVEEMSDSDYVPHGYASGGPSHSSVAEKARIRSRLRSHKEMLSGAFSQTLANRPCMAQCNSNMAICMKAPAALPGLGQCTKEQSECYYTTCAEADWGRHASCWEAARSNFAICTGAFSGFHVRTPHVLPPKRVI